MKNIIIISIVIVISSLLLACNKELEVQNSESQSSSLDNIVNTQLQESQKSEKKVLVAYFSLVDIVPEEADASTYATPKTDNTQSVAMEIQSQVGGDLFQIKTVKSYPISHKECSEIAKEEISSDDRVELSTHLDNINDYDIIYIGYPIWWYKEPMAIDTFLEEYDFSDKIIIPFCTSLGASIRESEDNIKKLCPNSTVLRGITLRTEGNTYSKDVEQWLKELNIMNK